MSIDQDTLKKYYNELYKLIDVQLNMLNMIFDTYNKESIDTDELVVNMAKILLSTRELLGNNKLVTYEKEEISLITIVNKSVKDILSMINHGLAFIYKHKGIKNPKVKIEGIDNLMQLSENELLNSIIKLINSNILTLREIISTLDSYI